jgi:Flp pilus assembly pilin Flp
MKAGGMTRLRGIVSDSRGQAMTEYVVLMMVIAGVCLILMDPDFRFPDGSGIYTSLRTGYDFIGHALCMPGP